MAQVKTRQLLIDVARGLFAKQGFESTTMNDIAEASGKGRRTLYTYFKSKEAVYSAVIDGELMRISSTFLAVARKELPPIDKLVELIFAHLSLIKEAVTRNGNLRAEFFRNIWQVESVRKKYDRIELDIFAKEIERGIEMGLFDVDDVALTTDIIHGCARGLEVPYIYGRVGKGLDINISRPIVRKLIYKALRKETSSFRNEIV
ncbi:MAG: TetR/AcrR family transcriptional regulator [Bacteroidaceae bacterium]|nr:TetR/AcrR family transcriptional regulator [Bacteroidaceae bacterium]